MSQCEAAESSSQARLQAIDEMGRSPLDEVLHQGARKMLVKAIEEEVTAYTEAHQHEVDAQRPGPRTNHRQRCGTDQDSGAAGRRSPSR